MDNLEKFLGFDLLPAVFVGQWFSVFEDLANIIIYIIVSVLTKVILNIIEKRASNAKL